MELLQNLDDMDITFQALEVTSLVSFQFDNSFVFVSNFNVIP